MGEKDYFSIAEVANFLGVSRITVYNRIKQGKIKASRIGRSYAIPKEFVANIFGKDLTTERKEEDI